MRKGLFDVSEGNHATECGFRSCKLEMRFDRFILGNSVQFEHVKRAITAARRSERMNPIQIAQLNLYEELRFEINMRRLKLN